MENNVTQTFEITVKTKQKLTNDEMWVVAVDFMARLEGYTTTCPKELEDASLSLKPILVKEKELTDYCTCSRPWGVSRICIVCEKPIKI